MAHNDTTPRTVATDRVRKAHRRRQARQAAARARLDGSPRNSWGFTLDGLDNTSVADDLARTRARLAAQDPARQANRARILADYHSVANYPNPVTFRAGAAAG